MLTPQVLSKSFVFCSLTVALRSDPESRDKMGISSEPLEGDGSGSSRGAVPRSFCHLELIREDLQAQGPHHRRGHG